MSSKGSVNLEKALCASTQTKNHYRMFCLKRQCIKNWHDSVMEITAWAASLMVWGYALGFGFLHIW